MASGEEIAQLYAVGAGNTARQLEMAKYGITSAEIDRLAVKAHPDRLVHRAHWERGFRAARGDEVATAALKGSHAEEEGARDSARYDLGFQAGRGCGWAVVQRSFGRIEAAGVAAGRVARARRLVP